MLVQNCSRHNLNSDQITALRVIFGDDVEVSPPKNPFWELSQEFIDDVWGTAAAVVVPDHILLEVLSMKPQHFPNEEMTQIISWVADKAARLRGHYACAGVKVFNLVPTNQGLVVEVKKRLEVDPSVEVDFRTGEVMPYGGTTSPQTGEGS